MFDATVSDIFRIPEYSEYFLILAGTLALISPAYVAIPTSDFNVVQKIYFSYQILDLINLRQIDA